MKAYALKAEMRAIGCQLNRVGRSRNWQLKGTPEQLQEVNQFIIESNEESWQWLAKRLSQHITYTTIESLIKLAKQKPDITVNELMAKTDCTIAQARQVIDEVEWLDED